MSSIDLPIQDRVCSFFYGDKRQLLIGGRGTQRFHLRALITIHANEPQTAVKGDIVGGENGPVWIDPFVFGQVEYIYIS